MKKEFKRPSQNNMVEATEGVAVVTDIPAANEATKELGGVASKYVKYSEMQDISKINVFKPTITGRVNSNFLNITHGVTSDNYEFPLGLLKMVSMRFRLGDIKKYLESIIGLKTLEEVNSKRLQRGEKELDFSERFIDPDWNFKSKAIADLRFANSKDKEFMAILDKAMIIKSNDKNELLADLELDPDFSIDSDRVPEFIKKLALGEFKIKNYGEELVVVLDLNKVVANVVIPSILVYGNLDISQVVSLGNSIYSNGYINTIISINNVDENESAKLLLYPDQFVCAKFQMSHTTLRDKLIGYNATTKKIKELTKDGIEEEKEINAIDYRPLSSLSHDCDLIFVRTADIAAQPAGAEALKNQMLGAPNGVNYVTVPLIKVPKNVFTKKYASTGNPMLDSLVSSSSKADIIDDKAVMNTFSFLLDGEVNSFNVGRNMGQDLAILPNFRKLMAFTLFGNLSGKVDLPRIDVADNGHDIAIVVSL